MARVAWVGVLLVALALPAAGVAAQRQTPPDRAAINALLDRFVPDVVVGRNLKAGWPLVAGYARDVTYRDWLRGNTPIQRYPARGTTFHGWKANYSYPNEVGFDIILQPSTNKVGPWSFRAEAHKLGGKWRITTWYVVAQFAPHGKRAAVIGPNDFGPSNGPGLSAVKSRVPPWVLILPLVALGVLGVVGATFATLRWLRRRSRVRAIERDLSAS